MAVAAKDISKYQGAWVDTGEPIYLVKISGGDAGLYIDPDAATNYNQTINAGKAFGGYHFAGGGDPIAEANYYLNAMKPWNQGEVPILDWEVSNSDPVGWVNSFANQVHSVAGAYPLIYMNLATLKAYDWTSVLNNCGLWLADWTGDANSVINVGYHGYVMLQYNDGPNYDHDEWIDDLETFHKYGWQSQPAPAPAPTPQPIPAPAPETTPEVQPTPEPVETTSHTETVTPPENAPADTVVSAPVQASPQTPPVEKPVAKPVIVTTPMRNLLKRVLSFLSKILKEA